MSQRLNSRKSSSAYSSVSAARPSYRTSLASTSFSRMLARGKRAMKVRSMSLTDTGAFRRSFSAPTNFTFTSAS